ncbi:MAG: DUF2219 family protein [Phycisphaerae bacterium]|nr:DUF2219 family protein [Saprospiraceae bacterium]
MKKSLFALAILFSLFAQAHTQDLSCDSIADYDELIYQIDIRRGSKPEILNSIPIFEEDTTTIKHDNQSYIDYYISKKHNWIRRIIVEKLVPLLDIGTPNYNNLAFKSRLDCINHVETITWLEFVISLKIDSLETRSGHGIFSRNLYSSPTVLKEALVSVRHRIDELMGKEFSMYSFTETSKKAIKSIYAEHTNDFFSFHNNDRDLTGAFRLEIATDLFKLRLLSSFSDKWWNLNSRSWYSYQTVFLGGEGYTPYLRDTSIFNTSKSFDRDDRPYASIQYLGRSKYRIYRHGQFRMFSQFKLGSIGSTTPDNVQSTIHRDITIGSYKPQGWGAQIAAGGRIAVSYEIVPELMIVSKNWLISRKWSDVTEIKGRGWINLSVLGEGKIGHEITSVGAGLNFSNRNFKESGGILIPFVSRGPNSFVNFLKKTSFNVKGLYRYVIHNSMLEGYGITQRTADEDPTSPTDPWFLRRDLGQIKPHIFILELMVTFRFKYCALVLKQNFMSPEFNMPVNTKQYKFGEGDFPGNHNTSPWNHIGTIGVIFRT